MNSQIFGWVIAFAISFVVIQQLGAAIGDSKNSSNVSVEAQNIIMLGSAASDVKSTSGYGNQSLLQVLNQRKAIPSNMHNNGGAVTNVWNGNVDVVGNNSFFYVEYTNVPQEACNQLVPSLSRNSLYKSTVINGSSVTGEVQPTVAASLCTDGSAIIWNSIN